MPLPVIITIKLMYVRGRFTCDGNFYPSASLIVIHGGAPTKPNDDDDADDDTCLFIRPLFLTDKQKRDKTTNSTLRPKERRKRFRRDDARIGKRFVRKERTRSVRPLGGDFSSSSSPSPEEHDKSSLDFHYEFREIDCWWLTYDVTSSSTRPHPLFY